MISRRKLLVAWGAGAFAAPLASFGQQQGARIPRVGYLGLNAGRELDGFRQGMRELGYVEGRTIIVDYRLPNEGENAERLSAMTAELVRLKADVLVAGNPPSLRALMQATKTIPIVMRSSSDPVASGIVASLARPGGNVTGVISLYTELNGKRMELLKEAVPAVSRLMMLLDPQSPESNNRLRAEQTAARALGLHLLPFEISRADRFENAFRAAARERANGLLVIRAPIMVQNRTRIAALAAGARLPAVYDEIAFAEAGGLMSYGANLMELHRLLATYVDKILKGAKPGDLPIEQPTKFELVVNMKTAKLLGLTIPQSILVRADRVIE